MNNQNSLVEEALSLIENYKDKSKNASTSSKFDANANVTQKNIATLMAEIPKGLHLRLNRELLCKAIAKRYDKELADKYISLLKKHIFYKNDETNIANYCASVTMYPWLLHGLKPFGGSSTAPTNLKSFVGGFINMVFTVSSQLSGAVSTPEFLMYMSHFIELEYGEDWRDRLEEVVDLSKKKRTLKKTIEDYFEQVCHSINCPTGARGFQSVFWNIAYYDKYYFEGIFDNFRYPDGSQPIWENVSVLQKLFMKWFNRERLKCEMSFPVETLSMLNDGEKPLDEEWEDFNAEMYAEGHSFFTYTSDSADSLSSCCFSKNTKVLWKSPSKGVQVTTLEELYNIPYNEGKKNLRIFHNGSWVEGKVIKLPNRKMYKVETEHGKEFIMTDNHINVTFDGEKTTKDLTCNDYLMFNTIPLQSVSEHDEHLSYEQGFVVGMFLGNGSFGTRFPNGTIYDVNFCLNAEKHKLCLDYINEVNAQLGGEGEATLSTVYNNVYQTRISSKILVSFLQKWTNWKEGTKCFNKELNLDCLLQSVEFRKGILYGWYATNGGDTDECCTTSRLLAEEMETLITSLGLTSRITVNDRTEEPMIVGGQEFNSSYPLYRVSLCETANCRTNKGIQKTWKKKNNSIFFKIKSIEEVFSYTEDVYCVECSNQEEPYFTLPCGLITHNCRLKNKISQRTFSYTLGAGGVSTGSKSVLTLNANRIVQDAVREFVSFGGDMKDKNSLYEKIGKDFEEYVDIVHKVQTAYNDNLIAFNDAGLLPLFREGYININHQYLTVGINGIVESAEFLGIDITPNEEYAKYVELLLGICERKNVEYTKDGLMFNTEMIPAENVGVKHAQWDKADGYEVRRDCYNSYFYRSEDESISIIDKMKLHGETFIKHLTGGSANHINLDSHLSKEQYKKLGRIAIKYGCNYYTYNIPNMICQHCGYIDKRYIKDKCPRCGSTNIDWLTRIIGYLKRIGNFSQQRQVEAKNRAYSELISE